MMLMQVLECVSRTGKDMLKIASEFDKTDKQAGYMAKEFADDIRPDKKWPRAGVHYIVVTDKNGNCSRSFKSFINAVEKSNPGFKVQWGDNFGAQFKGLKVGGVYGEVENEWDGKPSMRRELRWFIPIDRIADAKVPEPKYLPNSSVTVPAPAAAPAAEAAIEGFVNIPDVDTTEIPFF